MMCEQVTSITSVKLKSTNNFEISANQLLEQQMQDADLIYSNSSKFITHIKKLHYLFENLKYNSYFNYAKFKMVFKTDNPLLWLIPFEMESLFVSKDSSSLYGSSKYKIDTLNYENV